VSHRDIECGFRKSVTGTKVENRGLIISAGYIGLDYGSR